MIASIIAAITSFLNLGIVAVAALGVLLVAILPNSPFQGVLADISIPHLSSLNWVIPFGFMVNITGIWLIAVGIYYLVSIGLRWVKAVQ